MVLKQFTLWLEADFLRGDNSVQTSLLSRKNIYRLIIWILLIISGVVLVRLAPILTKPEYLRSDDFIRFWASGNLNVHSENPYDPARIELLQIQEGSLPATLSTSSIMLNPPWVISILMPFGLFDYPISRLLWLIISIMLVILSSLLVWRIYSGSLKLRWLIFLVVITFAPTISVLEKGQIGGVLLLGIAGFLYFTGVDRNDWLAGISLAVVAFKPQLILLFWLVLLLWLIQERRGLIFISAIITIFSLTMLAFGVNPHIIQQYISMLQTYQISDWATPTIGSYIRYFWLGTDNFWVQFIPSLAGGVWMIYHWYKHHTTWNWLNELPKVLLVSLLTSPYSWTYDLVILLPAILLAVVWITSDWKRWSTLLLVVIFLVINALDLLLHMKLDEFWFIWMVPALFIWFLLVRWQYPKL